MASLFFKPVRKSPNENVMKYLRTKWLILNNICSKLHVNHCCSFYQTYSMNSSARTAKLDTHSDLKSTVNFFVKIISHREKELFSERYVGCAPSNLFKLWDVLLGFVNPLFKCSVLLHLRSSKSGCCSISDDLSCSSKKKLFFLSRSEVKTQGHSRNKIIIWTWLLNWVRIIQVVPFNLSLPHLVHRVVFNRLQHVNIRDHISRAH